MFAPPARCPFPRGRAFTLVELLVVMGVIVILMSLLVPTLNAIRTQTNITKTESIIHGLSLGLDQYKVIHGVYPPDRATGVSAALDMTAECLVYYLSGATIAYDPGTQPNYRWKHPLFAVTGRKAWTYYYQFDETSLADFDGDNIPSVIDPWQNRLVYNVGSGTNSSFNQNEQPRYRLGKYDIYSAGPDGEAGNKDDVKNWRTSSIDNDGYDSPDGWAK